MPDFPRASSGKISHGYDTARSWLAIAGPAKIKGAVMVGENRTLEQRIRAIEDRLEIYNLIAGHPPSADTGASDYTASGWTEDGTFDRGDEFPKPVGRMAIAGTSSSAEHHRALAEGIAHFAGLPYVRVDGDT